MLAPAVEGLIDPHLKVKKIIFDPGTKYINGCEIKIMTQAKLVDKNINPSLFNGIFLLQTRGKIYMFLFCLALNCEIVKTPPPP